MEHTSAFDLNTALPAWLDQLRQSPQFRATDLAELESHIRDSVSQLQTQGLSVEESFIVATKRVGTVEKLEPEFAKVHRSPKLIAIHLLILAFLSAGCWFLWALLKVATMSFVGRWPLPAFTSLMFQCRSLLLIPPVLAAGYCLWIIARRNHSRIHWIGFFSLSAGLLLLLTFPTIIALVIPLIDQLHKLARP